MPRAFTVEEGGVVCIVQGGVLGLEVRDGFGKLSFFDSFLESLLRWCLILWFVGKSCRGDYFMHVLFLILVLVR